jgi:ribonuclease P protein component
VTEADPRVGFIVSKAVGNAVTRNRVKRRLRHLSRDLLRTTPDHTLLVVRALPGSSARPERLADDLGSAWSGALRKLETRTSGLTKDRASARDHRA